VVFVGGDLSSESRVEADLKARARALGVSQRVEFLGVRHDIGRVLHGLDLFVLPSLRTATETFSVAVLEAMASALPVIISRVGSLPDMVSDGREGFVVEPDNAQALSDRINLLLVDPLRAKQVGAAARARVELQFTLDRMVDQYSALFDELRQRSRAA
jgi:glycosyltransferase involved in cell wall biosynthesis